MARRKQNPGKLFEQDWKRSVPNGVYLFRPADCGGWRRGVPEIRFTPTNPFDFLMYRKPDLWALELKSVKRQRVPFDTLRPNQRKGLAQASMQGVNAGVVVLFREEAEAYYIPIQMWEEYERISDKKSMNRDEVEQIGVYIKAKRTRGDRFRLALDCFIAKWGDGND